MGRGGACKGYQEYMRERRSEVLWQCHFEWRGECRRDEAGLLVMVKNASFRNHRCSLQVESFE